MEKPHGSELRQEQQKPNRVEEINELVQLLRDGKLTKERAEKWLESVPEEEREEAKQHLEDGIATWIENLPEN